MRVAPRPECRCVFTSPRTSSTATPPAPATVEVLPAEIAIDADRTWPRSRYLEWIDRDFNAIEDGVSALWDLAAELSPSVDREALVARFAARVDAHRIQQGWRHPDDLAARIPTWLVQAARLDEPPEPLAGENFYIRAVAHVHAWALDEVPLVQSLRLRAARLSVARRFAGVVVDVADPAVSEPIALIEACARAFSPLGLTFSLIHRTSRA